MARQKVCRNHRRRYTEEISYKGEHAGYVKLIFGEDGAYWHCSKRYETTEEDINGVVPLWGKGSR